MTDAGMLQLIHKIEDELISVKARLGVLEEKELERADKELDSCSLDERWE